MLGQRGAAGRYKDQSAFLGLIDAVMQVEDRKARGKALTNVKYDVEFDSICTTLALISPRAYALVQAEFGGRSLRSMASVVFCTGFMRILTLELPRSIRAKQGRFQPGIVDLNFDRALEWTKQLDYSGPFVLATDDTKLIAALRSYQDGGVWRLAGMHGRVEVFATYEELMDAADISIDQLAEKVRE